jgi:hypothetical protein
MCEVTRGLRINYHTLYIFESVFFYYERADVSCLFLVIQISVIADIKLLLN